MPTLASVNCASYFLRISIFHSWIYYPHTCVHLGTKTIVPSTRTAHIPWHQHRALFLILCFCTASFLCAVSTGRQESTKIQNGGYDNSGTKVDDHRYVLYTPRNQPGGLLQLLIQFIRPVWPWLQYRIEGGWQKRVAMAIKMLYSHDDKSDGLTLEVIRSCSTILIMIILLIFIIILLLMSYYWETRFPLSSNQDNKYILPT